MSNRQVSQGRVTFPVRTPYVFHTFLRYHIRSVADTWELRKVARQLIGRRRSATMSYHKIGANSFQVRTRWGRIVLSAYKLRPWNTYTG